MAGGANKKFMEDKTSFLRSNVIEVDVTDGNLMYVADRHSDPKKAELAKVGRVENAGGGKDVKASVKTAGVFDFDLIKSGRKAELVENGVTVNVPHYLLKEWGTKARDGKVVDGKHVFKTPMFAHAIRAYWVPWSKDSAWSVQLGDAADYFFTATMDGCSLAISSGNAPIVTHGNYRFLHDEGRVSTARTLTEMASHHVTTLNTDVGAILGKHQYAATHAEKTQGTNYLVTVVGFRDTIRNTWSFYWQRRKMLVGAHQGGHTRMVLQDRLVPLV
jgi:hypothetical protein